MRVEVRRDMEATLTVVVQVQELVRAVRRVVQALGSFSPRSSKRFNQS